jgi:hypothetical protein
MLIVGVRLDGNERCDDALLPNAVKILKEKWRDSLSIENTP